MPGEILARDLLVAGGKEIKALYGVYGRPLVDDAIARAAGLVEQGTKGFGQAVLNLLNAGKPNVASGARPTLSAEVAATRAAAKQKQQEALAAAQKAHSLAVEGAEKAKEAAAASPRSKKLKEVVTASEKAVAAAKKAEQKNTPKVRFAEPVERGEGPARVLEHPRIPLPEVPPMLPSSVTGSFDPTENIQVTYKGKQPFELTSNEMADFGDALGVPNLGPLNKPKEYKYEGSDDIFEIPGGTEGKFTYEDMMHIKGRGVDASRIPPELHREIQQKIMRSLRGDPKTQSDAQVLGGLTFGYTSPNNPLAPNQLATSRLRMSSLQDLDRLVNMRPWGLDEGASRIQRDELSDQIAQRYGLNSAAKGGLGVRGSVDYSGYADLADMFGRYPEYFHRGKKEDWANLVERMSNQVPGLGNKTGSFGVAWQPDADVSAIDRHMVGRYVDTILADPIKRAMFEVRAMARAKVGRIEDVPHGLFQSMLLEEVGKNPSMGLRTAKGLVNPRAPEHLAGGWVAEPKGDIELLGPTYRGVIGANEQAMEGSGLHLFGNQWNVWDRIRRRLEPHENMFPGLENIPRLNIDQMGVANAQHTASGHKTYNKEVDEFGDILGLKPTRSVDPSRMRYFAEGGPVSLAVDIKRRR